MVILTRKEKELAVCNKAGYYQRQGFKKSEAVKLTMVDFKYVTEASIYNILRRNKINNNDK